MTSQSCGCRRLSHQVFSRWEQWQYRGLKSCLEISVVLDDLAKQLRQAGYPKQDRFGIRLALEEAIVNAIKHGHREDARKTVLVRFCVEETFFLAQVEDEGPGFQPEKVPDPRESAEQEPSGRGLLLMRHFMNVVEFNAAGNCVTLCKHRSAAAEKEEE